MPDTSLTNTDHERERRACYDACLAAANHRFCDVHGNTDAAGVAEFAAQLATAKLAERDKMFPAPVEAHADCSGCKHDNFSDYDKPCVKCLSDPRRSGPLPHWEPR